jgi:LPXTG-site transpeptidase (sortase) family protein
MKRLEKLLKISFALLLIGIGLFLFVNDPKRVGEISSSFSTEPVKVARFELVEVPEEEKPKRILIPRLEIDLEVKESEIIGGYWEVFDTVAGWGKGSSPPGYIGNQVIFAHAREGLFEGLGEIELKETIYVLNESRWYLYEVNEVKEVHPGQSEVIEQTEDERLTLYTCSGFRDQKRLVIVAIRH